MKKIKDAGLKITWRNLANRAYYVVCTRVWYDLGQTLLLFCMHVKVGVGVRGF